MFATSVIWRWYAFGVLLAIGFHCLLRPGELLLLTWADVMLSDDLTDCDGSGAVAIGRPKTRFSGGRIQHVLILCRWLGWYIAAVRDAFKPKPTDRIFPFTYACLLARWNELLHALSLPTAWTPSSLRAGGTTHYYRSGAHLEWIRLRGRWKVATSLEHYVQEAVAWLLQNQLSEKTKLIIKDRSDTCWLLVRASIAELYDLLHVGAKIKSDITDPPAIHPIRRRLLLSRQVAELREALAVDFAGAD